MAYSYPIDIWSFGCLIAELSSGRPLFPGRNEREQCSNFIQLLGQPPAALLADSSKAKSLLASRTPHNLGTPAPANLVGFAVSELNAG